MIQATDPEDPFIEDGPEPSTAGEWLDDSREGRDPDQQPQRLGGGFFSEAGFDQEGTAILRSEVTDEQ